MKKIFFLLALGSFLISAPAHVWAMEDETDENETDREFMAARPCKLIFRYGKKEAKYPLTSKNFQTVDGEEVISFEDTQLLKELKNDELELEKKVNENFAKENKQLLQKYNNLEQSIAERPIWEKHSKKFIAGAFGIGIATGVGAMYYFNHRK